MGTPVLWIAFNAAVLIAVALDLGVFHKRPHKIGLKEALAWSSVWVLLSIFFGLGILRWFGRQHALEFFTGYLIEKALSVDNLFVFLVIFRAFRVERHLHQRVLGWGIMGALIMRAAMIAAGAAMLQRFSWVMYVFGAFLVYSGAHMLFAKKEAEHPEQNFLFRFARERLRVTEKDSGETFFARENGKLCATPLFLVLLIVEITDVTLAVDSIPAIFGITRDPFIVYTSNVFAILGLRALYFLLAGVLDKFRYLTMALAFVLTFVGLKMIVEPWVHISVVISLAVVAGALAISLLASILIGKGAEEQT